MGTLCDFSCPRCDASRKNAGDSQEPEIVSRHHRPSGIRLGVGLAYPYVCKEIYRDIRRGKLGPQAKKVMFWMRRPGIFCENDIHVCESCGSWAAMGVIKICRLKPGKIYCPDMREQEAGTRLYPLCILDPEIWDVVWERENICRCGGKMRPRHKQEKLKCRHCGGPLEEEIVGHWD